MIIIKNAILHILDFTNNMSVYSDRELNVQNSIETFLLKHLEKSFYNQNLKCGMFYEDSNFKIQLDSYKKNEINFISFSRHIGEKFYRSISQSEQLSSCDILICNVIIDDEIFIVLFKCNNRMGFIHQVQQTEDGIKNDIINHYAIMPNLTQKIDEYAFINLTSNEIKFVDKKATINGETHFIIPEFILECAFTASANETLKVVNTITKKIAEAHGQGGMEVITRLKSVIVEDVQKQEYLEPINIGKKVFALSPTMQKDFLEEILSCELAETVKINPEVTLKKVQHHKIKTDTGIEIIIPLDYFKNSDFVEFINNPDGTISINLKNIGKIINK